MHRRLRVLRAYHGISQADLARLVNLDDSYISAIETGRLAPTPELEQRIRAALHWTPQVDALFDAVEKEMEGGAQHNEKVARLDNE